MKFEQYYEDCKNDSNEETERVKRKVEEMGLLIIMDLVNRRHNVIKKIEYDLTSLDRLGIKIFYE